MLSRRRDTEDSFIDVEEVLQKISLAYNAKEIDGYHGNMSEKIVALIKYKPELVKLGPIFLCDTELSTLMRKICDLPDFNTLPSPGKAILVALWTRIKLRYNSYAMQISSSLLNTCEIERLFSMILPSSLPCSFSRHVSQWFTCCSKSSGAVTSAIQIETSILDCIANDDIEKLSQFFPAYAHIRFPLLKGWNIFHVVASGRKVNAVQSDIIKLALNYGVDINALDYYGQTPLHVAARCFNYYAICSFFNESVAISKTFVDKKNCSPLRALLESLGVTKWSRLISSSQLLTVIKLLDSSLDRKELWISTLERSCVMYYILLFGDLELVSGMFDYSNPLISLETIESAFKLSLYLIKRRKNKVFQHLLQALFIRQGEESFVSANRFLVPDKVWEYFNLAVLISVLSANIEALKIVFETFIPVYDISVLENAHHSFLRAISMSIYLLTLYGHSKFLDILLQRLPDRLWMHLIFSTYGDKLTTSSPHLLSKEIVLCQIRGYDINRQLVEEISPYFDMSIITVPSHRNQDSINSLLFRKLHMLLYRFPVLNEYAKALFDEVLTYLHSNRNCSGLDMFWTTLGTFAGDSKSKRRHFSIAQRIGYIIDSSVINHFLGRVRIHLSSLSSCARRNVCYSSEALHSDLKLLNIIRSSPSQPVDWVVHDIFQPDLLETITNQLSACNASIDSILGELGIHSSSAAEYSVLQNLKERFPGVSSITLSVLDLMKNGYDIRKRIRSSIFRIGLHKLTNFNPDIKWLKLAFNVHLYINTIRGTTSSYSYEYLDYKQWDKFKKLFSVDSQRQNNIKQFFDDLYYLVAVNSNLIENTARVTDSDWEFLIRKFNDSSMKFIDERGGLSGKGGSGRGGHTRRLRMKSSENRIENFRRQDKHISYVQETLTALLENVTQIGKLMRGKAPAYSADDGNAISASQITRLFILQNMREALNSSVEMLATSPSQRNQCKASYLKLLLSRFPASSSVHVHSHSQKLEPLATPRPCFEFLYSDAHQDQIKIQLGTKKKESAQSFSRMETLLERIVEMFSDSPDSLIRFLLPLCALGFYSAAIKLIRLCQEEQSKYPIKAQDIRIRDTFKEGFYFLTEKRDRKFIDLIEEAKNALSINSSFAADDGNSFLSPHASAQAQKQISVDPCDIYVLTPIHFALKDQQIDFITEFLKAFPSFPLQVGQLLPFVTELGLFSVYGTMLLHLSNRPDLDARRHSLLSSFHLISTRDIHQAHFPSYSKNAPSGLIPGMKCSWYLTKCFLESLSNANSATTATAVDQLSNFSPQKQLFNYSYDYVQSTQGRIMMLQLMDGGWLPIEDVCSQRGNVLRALPLSSVAMNVSAERGSLALLHLAADRGHYDTLLQYIESNTSWLEMLMLPDRQGRSVLFKCLSDGNYSLCHKLLHLSSAMTSPAEGQRRVSTSFHASRIDLIEYSKSRFENRLKDLKSRRPKINMSPRVVSSLYKTLKDSDWGQEGEDGEEEERLGQGEAMQKALFSDAGHLVANCVEYCRYLWNRITSFSGTQKFLLHANSSTALNKVDTVVRARQALSILGIPFSYLLNEKEENSSQLSQRKSGSVVAEEDELFFLNPTFLYEGMSMTTLNQLKLILSGWLRMRSVSSNRSSAASLTVTLSAFLFHPPFISCLQFIPQWNERNLTSAIIAEKENIYVSKQEPLLELEQLGDSLSAFHMLQCLGDKSSSEFDGKVYADILTSCCLILEFIRQVCLIRTLGVVYNSELTGSEHPQQQQPQTQTQTQPKTQTHTDKHLLVNNRNLPFTQINQEIEKCESELARLNVRPVLGSITDGEGLTSRLRMCDSLSEDDFALFLTLNGAFSDRLAAFRRFILGVLGALLSDLGKKSLSILMEQIAESVAERVSLQQKQSLRDVLTCLQSLRIKDFWKVASLQQFCRKFDTLLTDANQDQFVSDMMQQLRQGTALSVAAEEKTAVSTHFARQRSSASSEYSNKQLGRSTQAGKLTSNALRLLKTGYRVASDLYWLVSSAHGLVAQSRDSSIFDSDDSHTLAKVSQFSPYLAICRRIGSRAAARARSEGQQGDYFRLKCCEGLKLCGYEPWRSSGQGLSPVEWAALHGDSTLLKWLLENSPSDKSSYDFPGHKHLIWRVLMTMPAAASRPRSAALGESRLISAHSSARSSPLSSSSLSSSPYESFESCLELLLANKFELLAPVVKVLSCIDIAAIKLSSQLRARLFERFFSDRESAAKGRQTPPESVSVSVSESESASQSGLNSFNVPSMALYALIFQGEQALEALNSLFASLDVTASTRCNLDDSLSLLSNSVQEQSSYLLKASGLLQEAHAVDNCEDQLLESFTIPILACANKLKHIPEEFRQYCAAYQDLQRTLAAISKMQHSAGGNKSASSSQESQRSLITSCNTSVSLLDVLVHSDNQPFFISLFKRRFDLQVLSGVNERFENGWSLDLEARSLVSILSAACFTTGSSLAEKLLDYINELQAPLLIRILTLVAPHLLKASILTQGSKSLVSYILQRGGSVSMEFIAESIRKGCVDEDYLVQLVENFVHKANSLPIEEKRIAIDSLKDYYSKSMMNNETLLHLICRRGFVKLSACWLRLVDSDIAREDDLGVTPLMCSIASGHGDVTKNFKPFIPKTLENAIQVVSYHLKSNRFRRLQDPKDWQRILRSMRQQKRKQQRKVGNHF